MKKNVGMKLNTALVTACVGLAIGCLAADTHAQPTLPIRTQVVVSGLSSPVGVYAIPGDTARLFIVQQGGLIRILNIPGNTLNATPFLNLSSTGLNRISTGGERGLLGLAFDPNYTTNGLFYVYYTRASDGAVIVERFTATGAPFANQAAAFSAATGDTATGLVMLQVLHPSFANHNGGALFFGTDNMLYAAIGDGGSGNDPSENAQSTTTLLGKLARLDPTDSSAVDGDGVWVPNDNPRRSLGGVVQPYVWADGLRNPWRVDVDRLTGDIWIGDVGQDTEEEINFQPRYVPGVGGNFAQVANRDYGWDCREGLNATVAGDVGCDPNAPGFTDPIRTYRHAGDNACSITGGVVYRGSAIPALDGYYVHADYCGNWVRAIKYNASTNTVSNFSDLTGHINRGGNISGGIVDFGEDANGEMYFTNINNGTLYKIVADTTTCGCPCALTGAQGLIFEDNAETDKGWAFSVGVGVTDGPWERAVPVNDIAIIADPAADSDGSGRAFVTDNAAGNSDVDGGTVFMTSPLLDFTRGGITICYDYYNYLSSAGGASPDGVFLEVSSNDGSTWTTVASHTTQNVTGWQRVSISQATLTGLGVANTNQMRLRFSARDIGTAATVEAGIDNISVHTSNPCLCDFDGNTTVDVTDLFDFLDAWFAQSGQMGANLSSDFDNSGTVDVVDLFGFLDCWFAQCPLP